LFNLLVSGNGWKKYSDTISQSRILEYTESDLINQFNVQNQIKFDELLKLPTIFMEESYGLEDQVVKVGSITSARFHGKDLSLEYYFDDSSPLLTNSQIRNIKNELNMDDFEFHRTHWAVKNVDLYKILLRNLQPRRQQPKVFLIEDPEKIEPQLVSLMMPFAPNFDFLCQNIKMMTESIGLKCRRADDIWENPAVIQDVVSLIDHSRIVICDCTGRNPNVFYEIGIAHSLGRDTILITQTEHDIPFDLRHLRYLIYQNTPHGLAELCNKIQIKLNYLT